MKRDLDLYRQILLQAEELPSGKALGAEDVVGYDLPVVVEHMRLLGEEGYADVRLAVAGTDGTAVVTRLKASGHDWLAAVRDKEVWSKTKESSAKRAGLWTLSAVKEAAIAIAAAIAAERFGH